MPEPANILLVHGAWADGSSWNRVIKILQAHGCRVNAVQLPHTRHSDNVLWTRRALNALDAPVVLAGHSYGGMVIGDASHAQNKVRALVFVAAFATDEGESLAALSKRGRPLPSASHIRPDADGFLFIDPATFPSDFAADLDPADARVMAVTQKPIHASIFTAKAGPPGWRERPSWYQVSEQDAMISPDAERFFSKRINAKQTISLASSHSSLISHAREVAALIEDAAASCG